MTTAVATSTQVHGDLQLQRPARALIGWIGFEEAARWLAGPGQQPTAEHRERVEHAHGAVVARTAGVNYDNVISPAPAALAEHIAALRTNPASLIYFQEGWDVAVADLSRVRAIQRHVLTDDATERVAGADPGDILSIAAIALPLAERRRLAAGFNEEKQSWVFSSSNPNLRIAGHAQVEVQPGTHVFGFVVSVSTSFIQVARYRGLYFLRDGYHRAHGFLARGITRVPAFVREFATFEEMRMPAGLSPQDSHKFTC